MTWHTTSALADHLGVSPNAIRSAYSKGHKVKGHHVERRLEGRKAFFRLVDTHPAAKWFEDKAPGGTVKGYDTQEELHEALAAESGETIHQRGDYTIVEESGHFDSVRPELYLASLQERDRFYFLYDQVRHERDELVAELQKVKEENRQLHADLRSHKNSIKDLERTNERLFSELQSSRSSGFKSVVRELRNRAKGLK